MRNIFVRRKKKINIRLALILPVITFLPVFILFVYGIGSVSDTSERKEKESQE